MKEVPETAHVRIPSRFPFRVEWPPCPGRRNRVGGPLAKAPDVTVERACRQGPTFRSSQSDFIGREHRGSLRWSAGPANTVR